MLSPKCLKWCPSYTPTQVELKRYPSSVHVMSTLCPSDVQVVQNVVNSINCPTQPTCIAHFDRCNCHNKLQWKYDKNTAWQLAPYPHPHPRPHHPHRNLQAWLNKFPSRAKKIDVLARVIFPAIFAFFNMSYWTFYLTQEANTDVKWTLKATILYETGVFYQEKRRIHVRISFEASCELHKMHSRCLSSSEVQDGTTMMCCYQCLSGRKMFKVFVQ